MQVLINAIIVDDGTQTRVTCDDTLIAEYAEQYQRDKESMPPVDLFQESKGQTMWMADGFHRYYAAKKIGLASIEAKIHKGGKLQAIIHSLKSNATHGLRRKPEDIQKAIKMAWDNRANIPELGVNPSARTLSKMIGCADKTVEIHLRTYAPERKSLPINGADGKTYSPVPKQKLRPPVPAQKSSAPPPSPKPVPPVPAQRGKAGALRDNIGRKIDGKVFPQLPELWSRKDEPSHFLSALSEIRCAMDKARESKDLLYAGMRWQELDVHLDSAYSMLKDYVPYVVCGCCNGIGCKCCHGGFQSKDQWRRFTTDEQKRLILKAEGLK